MSAFGNRDSARSNKVEPQMEPQIMEQQRFVGTVAGNPKRPPTMEDRICVAGSNYPPQHERIVTQTDGSGQPVRVFDFNFHAMKKSVSSGLLDVALLLANSSQLKHVVVQGKEGNPFYEVVLVLLALSIVAQCIIGGILIWLSRININEADEARHKQAEVLNNMVVVGIFFLTVLNVFIGAIGISNNDSPN